jgi:hypothetical protein
MSTVTPSGRGRSRQQCGYTGPNGSCAARTAVPFGVDWTRKALEEAEIGAEAREAILHRNAAAIMGRAGEDVVGARVAA